MIYISFDRKFELKFDPIKNFCRYSITENRWLETKRPTGTPSKTLASHAAVAHGHFILVSEFKLKS